MRPSTTLFFFMITAVLVGQQTIEPDQVIMGSFTEGDTECYNLVITEPGDYILTYNLMDATVTISDSIDQTLFTDYLSFFGAEPKEETVSLEKKGTYKVCFLKNGVSSMYQFKINRSGGSGTSEAVLLNYGDYDLQQSVLDNTVIQYIFNGKTNEKIQIGISGAFTATVKISSPDNNVLYNESFNTPPEDGLLLQFDLTETGKYKIELTPLFSSMQFLISLYLIEPKVSTGIEFNKTYAGAIVNKGIDYFSFYAYPEDTLLLSYIGATENLTVDIETPDGSIINCDNIIDEVHLEETLIIEQEGSYLMSIKSGIQGFSTYQFDLDIKPVPYELGTMIIRDMAYLYKKIYSFQASEDHLLRIGYDMPFKNLELKDPDGSIVFKIDSASNNQISDDIFNEVQLSKTGNYTISVWHTSKLNASETMKFCASIVPDPQLMTKDSAYQLEIPPYQRIPLTFNMIKGHVFRSGFPDGTVLDRSYDGMLETMYGHTYLETKDRTINASLINTSTEDESIDYSVMTIVPQKIPVQINVGDTLSCTMEGFESPGFVMSGITDDTIFIDAEISELISSPNENNIVSANSKLYLTTPSGETQKVDGISSGSVTSEGYLIRHSLKKGYILPEDGEYYITVCLDKLISESSAECKLTLGSTLEDQKIQFGTETPYEYSGTYKCTVPEGIDQLIVVVKKNNHIGYSNTWKGSVSLMQGGQAIENVKVYGSHDDYVFYVENPDQGEYILPLIADNFNTSIKGSVLFADKLPEVNLNDWTLGVISRPYGSDLKMMTFDQAVDTLFLESQGYGLWSRIEIYNERFILIETIDNMGAGYQIEGILTNLPAGTYYIRYVDSAVLYDNSDQYFKTYKADQSRIYMIYAGTKVVSKPAGLHIRKASTHKIGLGDATVTLSGSGLNAVDQVSLTGVTHQNYIPLEIASINDQGTELIVGNDFSNSFPGLYILKASNADTSVYYNSYLEIIPTVDYSIQSSLLTSNLYRTGRYQKCILKITNNGSADIPYIAGNFYTTSEEVQIGITNTPETEYVTDSINAVLALGNFTQMPFFIENLQIGESTEFIYTIYSQTVPNNNVFQVGYRAAILSEEDYYALQRPMATAWHEHLLISEYVPLTMEQYLDIISFDDFFSLWNDNSPIGLKSLKQGGSNRQTAKNAQNSFYKVLDRLPGKAPFAVPYKIVREGVEVVEKMYEEASESLKDILDRMKKSQFGNESGITEEEMDKEAVNSTTPEDKYGPIGYGLEHGNGYISNLNEFEYRIDYWNKEDASAPAAIVYIRDTIDTDFALRTLSFTELGFLKWKVKLDGGQYSNVNIDCRPDMPYIVNVEATVDHDTREVYWVHTTLDPATMELPDDPLSGYLPPIDSTGYQIGWVNYTIKPYEDLPHETSFENQAFVNFDGVGKWGPAPPYGPYTNILDLEPPWSYIEDLEPVQSELSFEVKVHAQDDESGIDFINIYVSKDYNPPYPWKTSKDTVLNFKGDNGSYYRFYSLASDKAGNTETAKFTYETATEINLISTEIETPSISHKSAMRVIPNPNKGLFKMIVPGHDEPGNIYVFNLSGKQVFDALYQPGDMLHLNHLDKGIYLIRFQNGNNTYTSKISVW